VSCGNGTAPDAFSGLVAAAADCLRLDRPDAQRRVAALTNGECHLTDGSLAGDWVCRRMPNGGHDALAEPNCLATADRLR